MRLNWSDVTPKPLWLNRRQLMAGASALVASPALARIEAAKSPYSTEEAPNSFEDITSYNNFYEFGTDKGDPAEYTRADHRPLVGRASTGWWTSPAPMTWPM
jgi:methionine sulfoxide reductase catalytic subunit